MAKLTRCHRNQLERIQQQIKAAVKFIERDTIAICRKGGAATTTMHATRPDGIVFYEIAKSHGSEFACLWGAMHAMEKLLNPPIEEVY